MKKYSSKTQFIIYTALLLIVTSLMLVLHSNNKTFAVAQYDLGAIPPDIQAALQAFDTPANPSTPYNTCDGNQNINQIPYEGGEFPWISTMAGSQYDGPAINPIKIPYGTQKIELVMNNLTFICHLATKGNVSFPNNADVNVASCSDTLPAPAIPPNTISEACVSSIYISNATASIPGTLSCIVGQQSSIWFQPTTKFWFENPSSPGNSAAPGCSMNPEGSFYFTSASPITSSTTLAITVSEIEVSQFYIGNNAVYMCVAGDYKAPIQTIYANESGCRSQSKTIYLSLTTTPTVPNTCPPWGNSDNNGTQVPINTPAIGNTTLPPASSSSPSSVTVYTPTNYTLNSVTATPSNDTTTFTPNQSSTGSFTANYTKFFKDYPYDPEKVTANYTENYSATTYKLDSTTTTALSCPAGSETTIYGCLDKLSNGKFSPVTPISTTTTTYSYQKVGNSSTGSFSGSISSPTSIPAVPECYNRHFEISLTSNTPLFYNNNSSTVENPATVVYKPSVTVTFSANHGGKLINPYTVNGVNTTINAQYHNMSNPSQYHPYPYACSSNPALPITYSDSSTSPGPPDPANLYTITYTCPATIPKLSYGDVACFNIGVDPSSGTMNSKGDIQATLVGLINQPSTGYSCSQPLQAKPYIKVFGGDVLAGLSSSDIASCYNNTASILGFNKGGSGQQGSGTTVADLATGSINGFVSGQNVLNMLDPLTFSNIPPSYGGNYGEGGSCGSGIDYYTYAQEIAKNPPLGFTVQQLPNSASIDGLTIPAGSHYIYYAEGNVIINGNIILNDSGVSPSNVPSFELVVKNGNITIGNNVTELDGVYIDEGGTITNHGNSINECNSNPTADYYDQCSKPLIVKGSLIAHTINLYRSYGTYHMSSSSPNPSDPYASEQFIYSPLTWLTPGYSPSPLVQSITSLPPIAN